jgi:hypothetical protein
LLAGRTVETARSLPYFWSDQYGARIQFAGRRHAADTVHITEGALDDGAPAEGGLLADGRTTAVLSIDRPRPFMKVRRELACSGDPVEPAGAGAS